MSFLLGADFGTGGAKVALISDAGEQLGYAFEEYPIHTDGPGWSEHDAPRYWEAFCRLTRTVLAESRVAPAEIRGIAVSSALPSVVFIEADGTPLPRAYNLMDRRATAEVTWLKEHVGAERIFSVTANRLEDHPALVNLLWERNHRPEQFRRIATVLTIDGYISFRLTGQATVHDSAAPSTAPTTSSAGASTRTCSRPWASTRRSCPRLCACEDVIGEVTPGGRRGQRPRGRAPRWPAARWTATPAGCRAAPSSRATSR